MGKARKLLILGILVTILPYLGFPASWKNILSTLFGLMLIYFSYIMYKDSKIKEGKKNIFDNFSENRDFHKNQTTDLNASNGENL